MTLKQETNKVLTIDEQLTQALPDLKAVYLAGIPKRYKHDAAGNLVPIGE